MADPIDIDDVPIRAPKVVPHKPPKLTITGSYYHQVFGKDPQSYLPKFERTLVEEEQVYTRNLKIGEKWTLIDTGWIKDPSIIIITNYGIPRPQGVLSPEQITLLSLSKLMVSLEPIEVEDRTPRTMFSPPKRSTAPQPFMVIYPGETFPISVPPTMKYGIWCVSGTVGALITAYPR